ncbi:MAG: hypothetical protein F6J93_17275 [Oscillatoria sp. SIO1A7]|nr:hypothetical protein [Oscillatoria sp. SIO1A7]
MMKVRNPVFPKNRVSFVSSFGARNPVFPKNRVSLDLISLFPMPNAQCPMPNYQCLNYQYLNYQIRSVLNPRIGCF